MGSVGVSDGWTGAGCRVGDVHDTMAAVSFFCFWSVPGRGSVSGEGKWEGNAGGSKWKAWRTRCTRQRDNLQGPVWQDFLLTTKVTTLSGESLGGGVARRVCPGWWGRRSSTGACKGQHGGSQLKLCSYTNRGAFTHGELVNGSSHSQHADRVS